MDGRGISLYSSGDDREHQRYLEDVEIVDMRAETQQGGSQPRRLRSNSHANRNEELIEPGSTAALNNQHPSNSKRRYTTLTTNTTPPSPDEISTTLSAFHFVDEDPWSSTEYEREVEQEDHRISISSTIYSQSYYDPYDVLPTPRTVPTLTCLQSGKHSQVADNTMRRGARSNYSELEDRVSFMELVSPTEGKPPLPTTPKPDFSTFYSAGRSSRSLERRLPSQEHGRRPHKISTSNTRSNSRANSYDDELNMQPPPTSNTLDPLSRADLVRKSRKLAQVFGQTPNGASLLPSPSGITDSSEVRRSFLDITSPTSSRHHNSNSMAALRKQSAGEARDTVKANMDRMKRKGIWPPPASTHYMSAASGRRYSTPLTPDEFEFLNELHRQEPASTNQSDHRASSIIGSGEDGNLIEIGDAQQVEGDSASFIDWDDESPGLNDKNKHPVELLAQSPAASQSSSRRTSISSLAFASPSAYPGGAPRNSFTREDYIGTELPVAPFDYTDDEEQKRDMQQQHLARQPSLLSLITPSLMSPEERAEAEKRRKREKLAKLHRFLGSRVPTGLVLGQADEDSESGLPGLSASSMGEETDAEGSSEEKRSWKKGMAKVTRRRSGSESGISSEWSDIRDRRKDDMSEDERSRMVKRAVRLEKVFGVAPPQTLYAFGHVSHAHSNSGVVAPPVVPTMIRSSSVGPTETLILSTPLPPKRGNTRPASRELLLPKGNNPDQQAIEIEAGDVSATLRVSRPRGASLAYTHYDHSLNSLGDILDRDDRASLQELHEILYQAGETDHLAGVHHDPDLVAIDIDAPGYASGLASGSIRSERRRSLPELPARMSIASLDSIGSIISKVSLDDADAEASDGAFQVRRRRAAKLTQFFGVDYRDLVQDVLDSIENGVELERGRSLSRQEAEDLLRKLRTIKGKRTGIFP
ncbi:hypothetical protein J3R30DRAFT_1384883 [Lentinula aciculospora]|uniref:Uncharacterized protein n=1 Tax=Lentinula aciculospora TaxID=153920 RepID=A0A9W9DUJ8_9AGAR|nr:hypothetical protein J3R30DRAFT_1384883 [Lentinula aciculospora]